MKTKEARKLIVLKLLQEGYHLSKLQIFQKANLLNGGDTIFQLRQAEHDIKMRFERNKSTGSKFAVYYIENKTP